MQNQQTTLSTIDSIKLALSQVDLATQAYSSTWLLKRADVYELLVELAKSYRLVDGGPVTSFLADSLYEPEMSDPTQPYLWRLLLSAHNKFITAVVGERIYLFAIEAEVAPYLGMHEVSAYYRCGMIAHQPGGVGEQQLPTHPR